MWLASTDPALVAILVAALGGGGLAQLVNLFLKRRQEKDSLVVTSAQGATTILNGVIEALHVELDRKAADYAALKKENERLDEELARLKASVGRRTEDA